MQILLWQVASIANKRGGGRSICTYAQIEGNCVRLDSLYMIPDEPNTPTRQSAATEDVHSDPLYGPV